MSRLKRGMTTKKPFERRRPCHLANGVARGAQHEPQPGPDRRDRRPERHPERNGAHRRQCRQFRHAGLHGKDPVASSCHRRPGRTSGSMSPSVNRQLNNFVQRQLRTESSGGSYADLVNQVYQQLQQAYGDPRRPRLRSSRTYANFTGALQNLASDPSDYSAQSGVVSAGDCARRAAQRPHHQRSRNCARIASRASAIRSPGQYICCKHRRASIRRSPACRACTPPPTSLLDQRDEDIDQLANADGYSRRSGQRQSGRSCSPRRACSLPAPRLRPCRSIRTAR